MGNVNTLKSAYSSYKNSEDGNFSMMAVFTTMTLIMGIGVALDTAGLTKQSRGLQDSLDGAVIAAAASGETQHQKLKETVQQTIDQNNTHGWDITTNVSIVNDEITATASAKYSTMLLGIFGKKELNVEVKSAAPIAQELPLNIAMVLDTTGSMQGTNIDDLKASAVKLVDIVRKLKNPESRISVVPFNDYVNIGMSRRNEPWMDVPADGTTGPAPACYPEVNTVRTGCTDATRTRYNDGVPYTETYQTGCTETSTPTGNMYCPSAPTIEWRGCAGSRDAPDNLLASAGPSNPIGGAMNENCGEEILPLEKDLTIVDNKINSLTTKNSTYIPTGLVWGWRTLTPDAPFTEAATSDSATTKALVLMTDGANIMTQVSRYGSAEELYHTEYDPSDTSADNEARDRILGLCDNIKADGIKLYTVAYKLPSASKKVYDTLEDCATDKSSAFQAKNRTQLGKAFEEIGQSLKIVRLSR